MGGFPKKRRPGLSILLPSFHALPKESNSLFRAFEIAPAHDQKFPPTMPISSCANVSWIVATCFWIASITDNSYPLGRP